MRHATQSRRDAQSRNVFPGLEEQVSARSSAPYGLVCRSKIMRPDNWQRAIDIRFVSTVNKIPGVLLITRSVLRCGCLFTARTAWRIRSAAYWHVNVKPSYCEIRVAYSGATVFTRKELIEIRATRVLWVSAFPSPTKQKD